MKLRCRCAGWAAALGSGLLAACLLPDAVFIAGDPGGSSGDETTIASVDPSERLPGAARPDAGSGEASPLAEAPLGAALAPASTNAGGSTPTATPSTPATADAGSPAALDAGADPPPSSPDPMDAVREACAASGGILEPDTTVCLFHASTARITWQAAALACQSRNGTLVSIKTIQRDLLITAMIDSEVWIGGNNPGTDPGDFGFVWRDGTPVGPYAGWAPLEPSGLPGEFCMAKQLTGEWLDRPCSELKAYVCEQTL